MFDLTLARRPQVIAINKVDLPEVKSRIQALQSTFADAGIIPVFISAAAGEGLEELVSQTWNLLKATDIRLKVTAQASPRVFRPQPVDSVPRVQVKGNTYIVSEPELERLLGNFDLDDPDEWPEFYEKLEKLGINSLLEKAGARSGDIIITGNKEWKWLTDEHRRARRNF